MTMRVHLSYGFALIRFPSSAARRTGFVLAQLGADMARDASAWKVSAHAHWRLMNVAMQSYQPLRHGSDRPKLAVGYLTLRFTADVFPRFLRHERAVFTFKKTGWW